MKNIKINRKTKCDLVTEEILNMILNSSYRAGDLLPTENEFCEMFGVSRVTLRESLKRLSNMGVITILQGGGTFVNELTLPGLLENATALCRYANDPIDSVFEARIEIEPSICRLSAKKRTAAQLEQVLAQLDAMRKAAAQQDLKAFNNADVAFHNALAECCDNVILQCFYELLSSRRIFSVEVSNHSQEIIERSLHQHTEIYEALARRDVEGIASLIRIHLLSAQESSKTSPYTSKP